MDRADPRVSPLRAARFDGLPPAVIHAAEFDPFRDEAAAYAAALRKAGVRVREARHPGMIHYFYAMGRAIPYALTAAEAIGADMRAAFAEAQKRTSPAAIAAKAAASRRLIGALPPGRRSTADRRPGQGRTPRRSSPACAS